MSGRLTGVATAGNDALGVAGGTLSAVPVLILAPGKAPVAGIRFATAALLKVAYDAAIAAGSVPDIYIDGSSSGGVVSWDATITLDPRTTISGRNIGTLDELDIANGIGIRPGTVRFLTVVSKSATAVATLGAETLNIILRDGSTLRNDGTGAASAPMFTNANAAGVLNIRAFDASGLATGLGGSADVVAKNTVAGATLNVHGYDSAIIASTTLGAIAATTVQYHKHSDGVSFSTTQAGLAVTPTTTLYSVATQIQMSPSDAQLVSARLAALPRLIIDINPDVDTLGQIIAKLPSIRDNAIAALTIQPWPAPPYGNALQVQSTGIGAGWWLGQFVTPVPANYTIEYEMWSDNANSCGGVFLEGVDANHFIHFGSETGGGALNYRGVFVDPVDYTVVGAIPNAATGQTTGAFGTVGTMLRDVINVRAVRGSAGVYGIHTAWPNAFDTTTGVAGQWWFDPVNGVADATTRYNATLAQLTVGWQGVNNVCGIWYYDIFGGHPVMKYKRIRVYELPA